MDGSVLVISAPANTEAKRNMRIKEALCVLVMCECMLVLMLMQQQTRPVDLVCLVHELCANQPI